MVVNLTKPQPKHLNVNEIFGPTVQGEGPTTGRLCAFLRLAGCNLSCSWCDTPYSWDWERHDKQAESHAMSVQEVADKVNSFGVPRLILTGGEPMLQQPALADLFPLLERMFIEVETNGTRSPRPSTLEFVDSFNVSPKLAHADDPEQLRINLDSLAAYARLAALGRATFKFVAQQESDFAEIEALIDRVDIPTKAVWIMPEGYTRADHLASLEKIADATIARGWNLTTRLHVLAWEQIRKR